MITIAETQEYQAKSQKLLSDDEQKAIISYLANHPSAGNLMQGTGGIRKLRWASGSKGKSGGVRVIYYYYNNSIPLYLLTMFGKNEKSNLSRSEQNELAKLVKILKLATLEGQYEQCI